MLTATSKTTLIIFLLLSLRCFCFGQVVENKLTITVDERFGNAIQNADVKIVSKSDSKIRSDKTDAKGIVIFENITDGDFQILISAEGFSEYKSDIISLKSNQTRQLTITLDLKPIEANVDIDNKDDQENSNNYGTTRILTSKEIENLPDDSEQLKKVLQRIVGESVLGGEIPIIVDGLADEPIPSKENIKSIKIYREIFSTQFEGTSGERIEIETKNSRAKFGGDIRLKFADSIFNAKDPFLSEKSPIRLQNFSLNLYGPITDKISWSSYAEIFNLDTGSAINAVKLDSNLQTVNIKTFQSVPKRQRVFSLNINAAPTDSVRLNLGYSYQTTSNKNLGVGGFTLQSRSYDTNNNSQRLRFNTTYVINPNIFNVAKGSISFGRNETTSDKNQVGVDVLDSFSDGSAGINRDNKSVFTEFYDDLSITLNKLRIGVGFMIRNRRNAENSEQSNITYLFNGRNAPILDANNNPLPNFEFISSLESYRRTLLFSQLGFLPDQIRNLGGGANQLSISNGNSNIIANQTDFASYLQIAYPFSKTLATSFGVRYENQTNIKSNADFSPRFGFIWSPRSEKKVAQIFTLPKISVGFGWFYSRFGIENILNSRRTTNANFNNLTITNSLLLDSFPNVPTLENIQQSSVGRSTLTIDEKFKTLFQTILNVSLDKNLAKNISFSFRFNSIKGYRQTITRNINSPIANTFSEQNLSNALYPFGDKQSIFKMLSKGKSKSQRIQLSVNVSELSFLKEREISFGVSYSYNRGKDDLISGNSNYQDAFDFTNEYAPSTLDGVHSINTGFSAKLPASIFITWFSVFRSGQRFNITTGKDSNGDGYYFERPAFAKDLTKQGIIFTQFGIFDPNPTNGDFIIPRNLGRGSNF